MEIGRTAEVSTIHVGFVDSAAGFATFAGTDYDDPVT